MLYSYNYIVRSIICKDKLHCTYCECYINYFYELMSLWFIDFAPTKCVLNVGE